MDKSPLRNQSLTRSIHYSTSIEVVSLCGSVAVSGNPPLRDHSSEAQAGSPLLSCHQKCSLARILPSVVKPLEVKNVCWELCCADELGRCWLPSCRSQRGRRLEVEAAAAAGACVGVSVFQQVHPRASEIPCDSRPSQSGSS